MTAQIKLVDFDYQIVFSEAKDYVDSYRNLKIRETKSMIGPRSFEIEYNSKTSPASLVILYNPKNSVIWGSPFRLATLVTVHSREPEVSDEPFSEAIWSWFSEQLIEANALKLNGTVTKTFDQSFSEETMSKETAKFEIRASWTLRDLSIVDQVKAWMASIQACAN